MGLLSILFKKQYPSKEEFPVLCFKLSKTLECIRKNWIDGCKSIMAGQTGKSSDEITLDEEPANHLSKAFQILKCRQFIEDMGYVHASETKAFSDLLFAEAFADELQVCLECVKAYEKIQNASQLNHQISQDLATCFSGNKASEQDVLSLQSTVDVFLALTQMATAEVFADFKTMKKKEISLMDLMKKQDARSFVDYEMIRNLTSSPARNY